tara:strand:- start:209 stop:406 length:198 start_codon:yes stop_codon:yes gene_type:complete
MLSIENAHKAIEIMFDQALKRMNELNDSSRQCLYEEYKEWIDNLGDQGEGQDAIIFRYIGTLPIN